MPDARAAALAALVEIGRGQTAGVALDRALAAVNDDRDRRLVTELVYGVTRWRGALDQELAGLCSRPLAQLQAEVREVLRLGLYQLRHTDRIPAHAAVHAAVEAVRQAGRPQAAGLVNAVLRRAAAQAPAAPPADLADEASHPSWLVRRWLERLGPEETRALLAADNAPAPVTLRVNRLRTDRDAILAELRAAGCQVGPGLWLPEAVRLQPGTPPGSLAPLAAGRCTVQGEGSMLVAHVADPQPGWLCLDVAAAPGGKATHLAEWMGDCGTVVANDSDEGRAVACAANARRLGLHTVRTRVGDARGLPDEFADACDLVLADVPCSGLGTLAQRADLRWRKQERDVYQLAGLQAEILAAAARCVKPGGRLVYSTCTTEPEENEAVVAGLLAERPDFLPEDVRARLPEPLAAAPEGQAGMVRLWPHRHGSEGFFIAVLRRAADRPAHQARRKER